MEALENVSGPVTAVFSWQVRRGCEPEFEAWIREISATASLFSGHMGIDVTSSEAIPGEYVVIFRFDTYLNLRAWLGSDICRKLLEKAEPFREREPLVSWLLTPILGRRPLALQAMFLAAGMIIMLTWLIMPILVQIPRP
jgi:antibiotic biosynthesis monooxygenase (ABM) superfamily enzyme